jgi:hypothetical protein
MDSNKRFDRLLNAGKAVDEQTYSNARVVIAAIDDEGNRILHVSPGCTIESILTEVVSGSTLEWVDSKNKNYKQIQVEDVTFEKSKQRES